MRMLGKSFPQYSIKIIQMCQQMVNYSNIFIISRFLGKDLGLDDMYKYPNKYENFDERQHFQLDHKTPLF